MDITTTFIRINGSQLHTFFVSNQDVLLELRDYFTVMHKAPFYVSPECEFYSIDIESALLQGSPDDSSDDIVDNPGVGGPGFIPWQ